jgi:hypothetical protein
MYTQVVQTLGGALERRYLSRSVSERKAKNFLPKSNTCGAAVTFSLYPPWIKMNRLLCFFSLVPGATLLSICHRRSPLHFS